MLLTELLLLAPTAEEFRRGVSQVLGRAKIANVAPLACSRDLLRRVAARLEEAPEGDHTWNDAATPASADTSD